MIVKYLAGLGLLALLVSCAAAGAGQGAQGSEQGGSVVVVEPPDGRDLTAHLRNIVGLNVHGDGPAAAVTIRGINSFYAVQEPLFVIDGTPISGGLSAAYGLVTINDIDYIRVLKDGADLAIYGVRGGNGVIEIYTKR